MFRNKMKKVRKNKGFSIIEVIIATGIVALTFMAITTLFAHNLQMEISNRNKIIASYLAQEGIEIVKQKRDSNWFSGSNWLTGIPKGDDSFSMNDQDDLTKGWTISPSASSGAKKIYLYDGAYVQSQSGKPAGWKETGFTRTVKNEYLLDDTVLKMTVEVGYNEGKNSVKITSYLYNGWFN